MSQARGGSDVTRRIIEALDSEPSRVFSVPEVHRAIAIPGRKIRSTQRQLERLAHPERALILTPYRGYFQSTRAAELPIITPRDLRFHAPILEATCRKEGTGTLPHARRLATKTPWHTPLWTRLRSAVEGRFEFIAEIEENKGLKFVGEWYGYPLTLMLYPTTETALVWIHGTAGPGLTLDLLEFTSYLRFWPALTGVPPPFWMLRQLDANIDVRGVHSSISFNRRSIAGALEIVAKWYQKEADLLRLESRIGGQFPVEELVDLFRDVVRFSDVLRFAAEGGRER